jgi:hypothetical protein
VADRFFSGIPHPHLLGEPLPESLFFCTDQGETQGRSVFPSSDCGQTPKISAPLSPDPRSRFHQRYCAEAACKKASKAASQERWRATPENQSYWRGAEQVERVCAWRKEHPRYWPRNATTKGLPPEGGVPKGASSVGLPEPHQTLGNPSLFGGPKRLIRPVRRQSSRGVLRAGS